MSTCKTSRQILVVTLLTSCTITGGFRLAVAADESVKSHPPMRILPVASREPFGEGRHRFVHPDHGDDSAAGTENAPWKTLAFSLRQLEPQDTLVLREGVYYEKIHLSRSGTEDEPITIRSYPGELAVIDGSYREFRDDPDGAWQPHPDGAEGEFVSTRTYFGADARRAPFQFLPAAWEPMWGIEEQRPLALGHFLDSMVPLHGYRTLQDLRSTNEYWRGKGEVESTGLYCGPGLWYNRDTGRIHIRLAHHKLPGLGSHAYRGETDPRNLKLSVAVGFGDEVLRISGIRHVRLHGIAFRGSTGSPLIHVYGSQNIEFDHLSVFGGFPGLLVNASQQIRVAHCAFRGLAAPWSSRAHMKYRGTASYQIVLRDDQPRNENIEFGHCEFTDDHDFAFLRYVKDLRFHHNYVDNFNDDGLECGAKLRDHTIFIYQNYIGRCLIPLTQHEIEKDEAPQDHDEGSGIYVYRNVFDTRGGTYRSPPREPAPPQEWLYHEGHLAGDHGSPIWPVMRVYHNTFLRRTSCFRSYFLFGLGAQGMRQNERDVFNNIFLKTSQGLPGVTILSRQAYRLREGGNMLWCTDPAADLQNPGLSKFRDSPLFELSREIDPPGWTTRDRFLNPQVVDIDRDLSLRENSPAIDTGESLPAEWPDPLRESDDGPPDIGVLPAGSAVPSVGVGGRITLFGHPRK